MNIIVDASVMRYEATGIAKVTNLLYQNLLTKKGNISVQYIYSGELKISVNDRIIKIPSFKIPDRIWRHIVLPFKLYFYPASYLHFPWNGNVPKCIPKKHKVISTIHDVLPLEIQNYFKNEDERKKYIDFTQKNLDLSDLIFTDSLYSKKQIEKNFTLKNELIVLTYGTTLEITDSAISLINENYLLYTGGYHPRKGLENLLLAFYMLKEKRLIDSKLVLTGKPIYFSKKFEILIEKGKKMNYIEEKGYVDDVELYVLMKSARALIYPSKYEGFGLPPLEAMSLGCPVLTTNKSSIPEVCGDAVLYCNIDDIEDFSKKITLISTNEDIRNQLIKKGLEQSKKFNWQNTVERFIEKIGNLK